MEGTTTQPIWRASTESDPLIPKKKATQAFDQDDASSPPVNGLIWIALAALGFALMTTAIRLGTTRFDFPTSAAVLLRSITHLVLSSIALGSVIRISPLGLPPSYRLLLAVRGVFGTIAMVLCFHSLSYLPAGEATAIFAFSPVITILLLKFVLNETTSIWDMALALVGILGIWLIAAPSSVGDQHIIGALMLLIAACFAAAGYVCVRGMGTQVHFMLSVFALGVIGVPVTAVLGGKEAFHQILTNHKGTGILTLGSFAAFFAQSCLNKGLQSCKAGKGIIMKNLEVPLAYTLGLLFLDERPAMLRVFGSILVISAVVLVGLRRLATS
ncbi:unnamed protein product [Agarophyton chilense]